MKPAFSFRRVKQEIRRLDSEVKPGDLAWKVAAILLSSLAVGPNADRIARFASLPYRFVREVARRLRANGVWEGRLLCVDWFEEKSGGVAFWLDVNVGLGYMERA
jgi:hypothetical protein